DAASEGVVDEPGFDGQLGVRDRLAQLVPHADDEVEVPDGEDGGPDGVALGHADPRRRLRWDGERAVELERPETIRADSANRSPVPDGDRRGRIGGEGRQDRESVA